MAVLRNGSKCSHTTCMLRFFTVSRLALNTNLIFEIGSSFYPEMALFPMSCVLNGFRLRRTLCSPQRKPLCGLAHRKNYSFLNWKLPSAFNNNLFADGY